MNLLLFTHDELNGSRLALTDRRASHIREVLGSEKGDFLRVGMINGKVGKATVVELSEKEVILEVELTDDPPPAGGVHLVVALPRPIMLQRILKQATTLGVAAFHFIRSNKVEKSFFQSPMLEPAKMADLVREGLEQAMDTMTPEVHIHQRFKPFLQDVVPTLPPKKRLVAHPGVAQTLPDVLEQHPPEEPILLAVGPEGGWNDFEIRLFQEQGFDCFSMGPRILHVDTAVTALLAQLACYRERPTR